MWTSIKNWIIENVVRSLAGKYVQRLLTYGISTALAANLITANPGDEWMDTTVQMLVGIIIALVGLALDKAQATVDKKIGNGKQLKANESVVAALEMPAADAVVNLASLKDLIKMVSVKNGTEETLRPVVKDIKARMESAGLVANENQTSAVDITNVVTLLKGGKL